MKKILLTTALVAFASSAFASTDHMYFKGGLGYDFADKLDKVSNDGLTTNSKKLSGGSLEGFAGDFGFGYAFNETFSIEVFGDFAQPSKKVSGADFDVADALTGDGTATLNTLAANVPLAGAFAATTGAQEKIAASDVKNEFKETSMGLGAKLMATLPLHEKFSVSAGAGAEVSFKELEATYSGTLTKSTAKATYTVKSKSKRKAIPVGVVSVAGDYSIADGVTVGIGYDFKFNTDKEMKAKNAVKKVDVASTGATNLTAVAGSTDFIAKDARFGTTSKMNHIVKATVGFAL